MIHLLVDSLGLLIAIVVTAANADDGTAAPQLLESVNADDLPRLNRPQMVRVRSMWG